MNHLETGSAVSVCSREDALQHRTLGDHRFIFSMVISCMEKEKRENVRKERT
jgi:hypothetical protein